MAVTGTTYTRHALAAFGPAPVPRSAADIPGWLGRLASLLAASLRWVHAYPPNDCILIEGAVLASGSTQLLEHKLGRRVRGWRVVDRSSAATVYRDTASTADLALYLPLVVSASLTVSIEAF